MWRSASSCGFFVTERWVDACVACLTHITHTQRVTLVSACLPDCLSAWHRLSLVTYVSRARTESRPHSHRRSPTALSMCGVTWRPVGCIFRWYYVIVSHGAAALSFTVCATALASAPVSASAAASAAAAAVVSGQKSRCCRCCCLCHCRRQSGSRIWVSSVLQCGECAAFVAVWEFARPPSRHRQQHLHLQILGVSFGEISLSVCRLIWQGGN